MGVLYSKIIYIRDVYFYNKLTDKEWDKISKQFIPITEDIDLNLLENEEEEEEEIEYLQDIIR